MDKRVVAVLGLTGVVLMLSVISIKMERNSSQAEVGKGITITDSISEPAKKNKAFSNDYVVTEPYFPRLSMEDETLGQDVLPIGTLVSVKPIEGNSDWVEIESDPKKGFVEKSVLKKRETYIEKRESKRKPTFSSGEFKEKLDADLASFLAEKGGDISVHVETTDNKFAYNFYGDEVKRTASSIKLPFISYLMTLVDSGLVDLDTVLTYTANFKLDGTGIIQFEPFGSQYTVKELAELVIRHSDNVAYIMLLNFVGEANFIQFLAELDPASPPNRVFSTARILSKSMEYVHKKQEKSDNMKLLYNWIQNSTFDDGVEIGLPGVDVAHKTGWMPMYKVSNDISLVFDKERPYYMTIMTVGYGDDYSEQAIGDIAKLVDKNMLRLK
ncbi:serine hydrolase [Vagococcus fessus]|nr:serine hydrolase [Vagococcus fessus]